MNNNSPTHVHFPEEEIQPSSSNALFGQPSREPKVVIIREEFVDLTKDPLIAIVLYHLLYSSQRVKDFALFLQEEKTLLSKDRSLRQYGWFYKSAHDLIQETMLCVTNVTLRKYLRFLIDKGWVSERKNPFNKWDKTLQYRINLKQLQLNLLERGWTLPGFPREMLLSPKQDLSFEESQTETS